MRDTSVILFGYNRLDCLKSMLDYIGDSTLEVIVADEGSTDGTLEWLDSLDGEYLFDIRYTACDGNSNPKEMAKRNARGRKVISKPIENPCERKIFVGDRQTVFEEHRSGWKYVVDLLSALHDDNGITFDGFIESSFGWNENFMLATGTIPYSDDWIGFLHNPPNMPPFFEPELKLDAIFEKESWKRSMPHCRGLFCLSEYLAEYTKSLVSIPVNVVYHPTEVPETGFDFDGFMDNSEKKVVQIGYWLRYMHAIWLLPLKKYGKICLKGGNPNANIFMMKEKAYRKIGLIDNNVAIPGYLNDREYDMLLNRNIAFVYLYDSSANNVIIECISRNTPLLVNRLPAVEEYLGVDYPFYYDDLEDAAKKAEDVALVKQAHEYLKHSPLKERITAKHFMRSFVNSEIYTAI